MKKSLAMMLVLIMVCALPGIASANGKGSINGACITQNAVSIELEDIKFEKSVKVELFSDKTLLTTATLNEGFVDANQLQKYVTCCIPTKGADEAWSLTPWIPRDNDCSQQSCPVCRWKRVGYEEASHWMPKHGQPCPALSPIAAASTGPVLRRMPYPLSWRTLHLKKAYR